MQPGKALSVEQKQFIVNLKRYFDGEKSKGPTVSTLNAVGRISEILNIGKRTTETVLANCKTFGVVSVENATVHRGKPPLKVRGNLITQIRSHIRSLNMSGQHVSIRNLHSWIKEELETEIPTMTLWRALLRIGMIYGDSKRRSMLKEQDYVINARRKYLREKIQNRNSSGSLKRPEVYLDETYLNKNHSSNKTWFDSDDGPWVNKPSGKGPRLIILHAITNNGWIKGADLVFQAKTCTGDYHGQMNHDNFSKWFTNQLIPNIPKNSLIIMDNAKYHNVLADNTFPTTSSRKHELMTWLINNYPDNELLKEPNVLKSELYELCKKLAPPPTFLLDKVAEDNGHNILRTPQYHCELQPIEGCWAVAKNYCRRHCDFSMAGLRENLNVGFTKVTKTTCRKLIKEVFLKEDQYWKEDAEVDAKNILNEVGTKTNEKYFNAEEGDS